MIDFIRFDYRGDHDFGFKSYVVFGEETENNYQGCMIYATSSKELREALGRVDGLVGVMSEKAEVNRYAVMRKKVDILLDFPGRELDYPTFKLAREKDVYIEFSLSTLMSFEGWRRVKYLDELKTMFKVVNKFDTPFILTSGAKDIYGMRHKTQIYHLFRFFGADIERAEYWANRLYRRLYDDKYIMDGVEII